MTNPSLADTLKRAKEDAAIFIKLESGESARLHIVSPPMAFATIHSDAPPVAGAPKTLNVPFGAKVPGYQTRPQWAFEVIELSTGRRRLLVCGAGVAQDILEADRAFRPKESPHAEGAGFPRFDIVLTRRGEGRKTSWSCDGFPTEYAGDRAPELDMDVLIRLASPADLARLTRS